MDKNILKFHAVPVEEVVEALDTGSNGLSSEEAKERLDSHGPNRLPRGRKKNPLLRLLSHFNDVLIYVLLASAIVTALLDHWIDTSVILGVVVINAFVGFLQEGKAEKAIEAVRNMLSVENRVLRDGRKKTIAAEDLVPGDMVMLSSGDRVPADLRIIEVHELRVNEASLTGESETVSKSPGPVPEDAPLGDRTCMAYSGTIVASGTATAVVVATGGDTEIGRINRMLSEVETMTTPLLRQVNRFGVVLSVMILAMAGTIFALGFFLARMPLEELFMAVVAIAVAAIPEGLPAVISIILAIGVRRMAGRNAIIRRLPGVETLGSVAVICTDKTGTLTKSEMTVTRVVMAEAVIEVEGAGYDPEGALTKDRKPVRLEENEAFKWFATAGAVCNEARLFEEEGSWNVDGNPTEGALLTLAKKAGQEPGEAARAWKRIDAIPFESDHKFMATLNESDGERKVFLKGAPEAVLPRCGSQMQENGHLKKLDEGFWEKVGGDLADEGFRLLAVAMSDTGTDKDDIAFEDVENGFTLLGFAAIMDPPRPEAVEAVEECRAAGIRVKMITGDHARTAAAIAHSMGIGADGRVMTGPEIEKAEDDELAELVEDVDVFARVSPEHKLRLVTALQERGHITAMTGDGVNDAPALKKADIGIAMGRKGTEAAKEAAEMVLADDNFASIVHAVEEGRTVYDNLKKTILFMLPTNGGESLVIVTAIALGFAIPLTPVQVLWVNMVTAVTLALALAFEPMERDVMERPPRPPGEPLVQFSMLLRITYVSVLLMAGSFGMFAWYKAGGASEEFARTVAVNTLIIGEIVYLFNSRYFKESSISIKGLRATPQVWGAAVAVLVLQMPFTYLPLMQGVFGTAALGPLEWIRMFAIGGVIFLVVEAEKALVRRTGGFKSSHASSR